MNKIATHRISDAFQGEVVLLKHITTSDVMPPIDYAHKDEYYIFFFLQAGYGKMGIDFEEHEFTKCTVLCIRPGQVHFPVGPVQLCGWMLAVDSMMVKDEYKAVFEQVSLLGTDIQLNDAVKQELEACVLTIQKRLKPGRESVEEQILHDLISYYVGMIAEIYRQGFPVLLTNRMAMLTFQFKSLLSVHYQTWKRPSQYAAQLNISSVYLNEVVKKTTGLPVSEWILNEIMIQAKRLLYYTTLSIKEIALELGYEDWAYFTRLFTRASGVSPSHFRKQYLK